MPFDKDWLRRHGAHLVEHAASPGFYHLMQGTFKLGLLIPAHDAPEGYYAVYGREDIPVAATAYLAASMLLMEVTGDNDDDGDARPEEDPFRQAHAADRAGQDDRRKQRMGRRAVATH